MEKSQFAEAGLARRELQQYNIPHHFRPGSLGNGDHGTMRCLVYGGNSNDLLGLSSIYKHSLQPLRVQFRYPSPSTTVHASLIGF